MSKATVYRSAQVTAERLPMMKREQFLEGCRTKALGADVTSVKCKGKWLPIGITVDALTGLVLTIDQLSGEYAQSLQEWVAPIAESVEAQVLVSDDADAFKTVADQQGLYLRYARAPAPRPGQSACLANRLRNLFLDRWSLWPRLTFYRTWQDANGDEILDGANNASERAIGWWIKERYRTMRGYKRQQSALNVSRLIAYCGNHLVQGLDLANLVA